MLNTRFAPLCASPSVPLTSSAQQPNNQFITPPGEIRNPVGVAVAGFACDRASSGVLGC